MSQFNIIPGPKDVKSAERFSAGLLGDILGPLTNKLVYKVDSAIDKAVSSGIDKLLGNRFQVTTIKENQDLFAITSNPVIGSIQFLKGKYKNFATNGSVYLDEVDRDYRLPYATICTYERDKIEAITDLRGQQGSVKELFGFTDWKIQIRGFIMRDGHDAEANEDNYDQSVFPAFSAGRLRNFSNLPDSIAVAGGLFSLLRIRRIYIKSVSFQEVEGKPNVLAYNMSALSDNQIEINIKP